MNKEIKIGQAGKPNGFIGRIFGFIMSKLNQKELTKTIETIDIQKNDTVLEIGFGPGNGFKLISKLTNQTIHGVDHSEEMVKMASNNNQSILNNQLKIKLANADNLPFPNDYFDKIYSINCIYFWNNPELTLQHIKDKLKPNGLLAITVRNSNHGLNKLYSSTTLEELFKKTEFQDISIIKNNKMIIALGKKR